MHAGFKTSVRDNHLKLQPIVRRVSICQKLNIAIRRHSLDATHLNTDGNHGDVGLGAAFGDTKL